MGKDYMNLALRDPAFAALRGEMASDFGNEFEAPVLGGEDDAEFGGIPTPGGTGFGGFSGFSGDYDSFGGDYDSFGADAAAPAAAPHPAQVQAIVKAHMQKTQAANRRKSLIDPNMGSDVKIQRYSFTIGVQITAVGTAQGGLTAQGNPTTHFHPEDVTTNIAQPGFVLILDGRVANVSWTVGQQTDAYVFNPISTGSRMSLPPLTPANQATVLANYTGLPLMGLTTYTGSFPFTMTFSGHATVAG
jgi:hypothetical protein